MVLAELSVAKILNAMTALIAASIGVIRHFLPMHVRMKLITHAVMMTYSVMV
jgi:hypothetical protein